MNIAPGTMIALLRRQTRRWRESERINAELCRRLAASEARFDRLTEAVPQIVAVVDRDLQLRSLNEHGRAYTGQTLELMNDTSAAWIVHRDDQQQLPQALLAIAANVPFVCELRLRRADGAYRRHELRAVPLASGGAEATEWILVATDIEATAAEATAGRVEAANLREANRLLMMAEEMTSVGHYRIDLRTNEAFWSDDVYRTYGLPTSFVPTFSWILSAYHSEDRERIIAIIQQTLSDGSTFRFDSRIVRLDGSIRFVISGGQVERTPDGKIVALFGVLQDVTLARAAEREREQLAERVMLATKAGKIGIWEWNIATDLHEWDPTMLALYGRAGDTNPTLALWANSIEPADRERSVAEILAAVGGSGPLDTEFRVVWPNGEVHHLRAMGTLVRDASGAPARMVGANWDITEVRVLAERWRTEKERAERANHAKSEFLARMSHEIRTPLNGVIGFTTLLSEGALPAEQRRYVTLLGDSGRLLLAIINDILDFSKFESGTLELERVPIDLRALVDGAVAIVRAEAAPRGLTLTVDCAPDLPLWVAGDPTRLRQILLNLLSNALKFTEHGHVRLDVRRDVWSDAALRFAIADTGIGISDEQRPLLFSEFSQLEAATTRRYGGTGLGLAICNRLVTAMGGTIGVDSRLGAGSTFWFSVDLPEIGPPEIAAPPARRAIRTPAPSPHLRILVADDNGVNQIVLKSLLTRDGHDVVLVENGSLAVEAVKSRAFDLVLMDIQMPVMGGLEATRMIRGLPPPLGQIPIVAVTANAMAEEVEICRAAGMDGHVPKPIERAVLRATIARWVHDDRSDKRPEQVSEGQASSRD